MLSKLRLPLTSTSEFVESIGLLISVVVPCVIQCRSM